jgi:hypothetical protein
MAWEHMERERARGCYYRRRISWGCPIYLRWSRRDTLLIHSDHSMAKWEADVQNYTPFDF